jgi:signal transduction histidine kinase
MQTVTVSWLKSLDSLSNVPAEQLQWFIDTSSNTIIEDGELLFEAGNPITGPHIVVEGAIHLYMLQNGVRRDSINFGRGDITGYLPYSRGKIAGGFAKASGQLQLLSFPTERIQEMIKNHFELTQALVHIMSNRVRDYTSYQQQNEKMMALGKLSAGLAHELNNPASAIVRDSASLKNHLRQEPKMFKEMARINIDESQVDTLMTKLTTLLAAADHVQLTLKQRTALEDELADWFLDHEIENAYVISESFVDFNFSVADLEELSGSLPKDSLSAVFTWLSNLLITERMVEDIQQSSKRIAELVSSIKTFTHMDRAQVKQFADIHIGIKNTLTMLGYKVRKGNITVVEEYDTQLPPVKALIGELNQVWTNLIDNALDAMDINDSGILTIRTERDKEFVQVTVIDNGPGIPANVLHSIFDPFYTTKPMGKGTGMGLEVVQRIVHQHDGSVKVRSIPGKTEFIVCFPIDN